MPTKNGPKAPEVNAIAKLEASATASYQHSKRITEVIPPDVTRAKVGAWLTLISPITEWAGLRGDQLRHKRDLLRIQQESVLTKIAQQAKEQLVRENWKTEPVPTKFLVPFLERASLEDEESELCKRWADLLVSAATGYDPSMIRFSAVLAEIGPGEVALLDRIVKRPRGKWPLHFIEDVPLTFSNMDPSFEVNRLLELKQTDEEALRAIVEGLEYPGTICTYVAVNDWEEVPDEWTSNDEDIASNLVSLGILHLVNGLSSKIGEFQWYVCAYALTSFGFRFLKACDRELSNALESRKAEFQKEIDALRNKPTKESTRRAV